MVKLAPVPVAGLPPAADHEKVYGLVPPVAEALQVTGLPAVALPHVTVTTIGWGATVTITEAEPLLLAVSVAFAVTWKVPFTAYVVVKLGPEPVDGLPLGAVQVNV